MYKPRQAYVSPLLPYPSLEVLHPSATEINGNLQQPVPDLALDQLQTFGPTKDFCGTWSGGAEGPSTFAEEHMKLAEAHAVRMKLAQRNSVIRHYEDTSIS